MKTDFEIGDTLKCKRDVFRCFLSMKIMLIKNKLYTIIEKSYYKGTTREYRVMGENRIVTFYDNIELYEWFYSQKELRNLKLKK